jgi:hypothetical protein
MALQLATLLLQRWRYGVALAWHCSYNGVAVDARHCCCTTLRLNFFFAFFLLDNFRRENESEKEKKE